MWHTYKWPNYVATNSIRLGFPCVYLFVFRAMLNFMEIQKNYIPDAIVFNSLHYGLKCFPWTTRPIHSNRYYGFDFKECSDNIYAAINLKHLRFSFQSDLCWNSICKQKIVECISCIEDSHYSLISFVNNWIEQLIWHLLSGFFFQTFNRNLGNFFFHSKRKW